MDFEKDFTFYVEEKSEVIDLSKILCSDVPNAKIAGSNALSLLGNFNSVRDAVPVAEFYQNIKDRISTASWNSWSCPPSNLERGETCYSAVESKNLLAYAPRGDTSAECFGSISGEYKSGRVNRKILSVSRTVEDSLAGLVFRLGSENERLRCGKGCYKKISLDVSNSEVADNLLTRTEIIYYKYKIECLAIESADSWKVEGKVDETKSCLSEKEFLEFEKPGQCENYCPVSGARICSGEGFRVCGDFDGNGCFEWGEEVACAAGEKCDLGQCYLPKDDGGGVCISNCNVLGEQRCQVENVFGDPGIMIEECRDIGECNRWIFVSSCTEGQTCEQVNGNDARCISTACTDECSAEGMKQCYVDGRAKHRVCGNYDADSCLEWSSGEECLEGEICFEGACVVSPPAGCTDSDGDGFGVGAGCAIQDCNDGDSSVWELIEMCHDWDGDGYGIKQSYGRPLLSPQCVGIMPLGIIAGKIICPADDANLDCNDDDASVHSGCGQCPDCNLVDCGGDMRVSAQVTANSPFSPDNICTYISSDYILIKNALISRSTSNYVGQNNHYDGNNNLVGTSASHLYCENGYWKWRQEIAKIAPAENKLDITSLKRFVSGELHPTGQFVLNGQCSQQYGGALSVSRLV